MVKKRIDRVSFWNKRAQVTIFIIIGVIIFAAFIFVLMLTSSYTKNQLNDQKESILVGSFKKEALRLYVEDCLEDGLVNGLQIFVQHGGISGTEGGLRSFQPGITGVVDDKLNEVFYGILNFNYGEDPNKYPCSIWDEGEKPAFCKYKDGDEASFGSASFTTTTLNSDLSKYLETEMDGCMKNRIFNESNQDVEVGSEGSEFVVRLGDAGITIGVTYPLSIGVSDEVHYLSEFDFFYETSIKEFLDKAVVLPISEEVNSVDSEFNPVVDELDFEFERHDLANGDTVFEYTPVWGDSNLQDLKFRIARQNRAPALDYISQCSGEGYDYLVIPGAGNELGEIKFTPTAHDPDEFEGEVEYQYELQTGVREDPERGVITVSPLNPNLATSPIKVYASDGKGGEDWQDVRVRIQPGIQPEVIFSNPTEGVDTITPEDPLCITVVGLPAERSITVVVNDGTNEISYVLHSGQNALVGEGQVIHGSCSMDLYGEVDGRRARQANFFSAPGRHFSYEGDSVDVEGVDDVEEECSYSVEGNTQIDPLNYKECIPGGICCTEFGTLKLATETCAEGESGCFSEGNSYKELKQYPCGVQGNFCGEGVIVDVEPGRKTCADPDTATCSNNIDEAHCTGQEAFSLQEDGWCSGDYGCEWCNSEVVFLGLGEPAGQNPTTSSDQFECGCSNPITGRAIPEREGKSCDDSFTNHFAEKICKSGSCEVR